MSEVTLQDAGRPVLPCLPAAALDASHAHCGLAAADHWAAAAREPATWPTVHLDRIFPRFGGFLPF